MVGSESDLQTQSGQTLNSLNVSVRPCWGASVRQDCIASFASEFAALMVLLRLVLLYSIFSAGHHIAEPWVRFQRIMAVHFHSIVFG